MEGAPTFVCDLKTSMFLWSFYPCPLLPLGQLRRCPFSSFSSELQEQIDVTGNKLILMCVRAGGWEFKLPPARSFTSLEGASVQSQVTADFRVLCRHLVFGDPCNQEIPSLPAPEFSRTRQGLSCPVLPHGHYSTRSGVISCAREQGEASVRPGSSAFHLVPPMSPHSGHLGKTC